MPKFRVKLRVTITTHPLVLQAFTREDLNHHIDGLDLLTLLQTQSDGLHVAIDGEPQRVFDNVPITSFENRPALTEATKGPETAKDVTPHKKRNT